MNMIKIKPYICLKYDMFCNVWHHRHWGLVTPLEPYYLLHMIVLSTVLWMLQIIMSHVRPKLKISAAKTTNLAIQGWHVSLCLKVPADVAVVEEGEVSVNLLPLQTLLYGGISSQATARWSIASGWPREGFVLCVYVCACQHRLSVGLEQYMRLIMTFILINYWSDGYDAVWMITLIVIMTSINSKIVGLTVSTLAALGSS